MPNLSAPPLVPLPIAPELPADSPVGDVAPPPVEGLAPPPAEDVALPPPEMDSAVQVAGTIAPPTALDNAATSLPHQAPRPHAQLPLTAELGLPRSSAEVREFIRQAALGRGMDPDIAVRVVLSEGGLTPATWVGDHGSSFGPLQLHYGGLAGGGKRSPASGRRSPPTPTSTRAISARGANRSNGRSITPRATAGRPGMARRPRASRRATASAWPPAGTRRQPY